MASSLGPQALQLQAGQGAGQPRDRLRAVSCRAPGPSLQPPTGLSQASLHDLMAAAVSLGHSLWWDPARPEEPEGWLGPGCLAPSVMTSRQGLGT